MLKNFVYLDLLWVSDGLISHADFFKKIYIFKKILSETLSECNTVWIWAQTVCKGYQQTTKVAVSNGVARTLKKLSTSKGDYWIKQ